MKEEVNQARWPGILAATGVALYLCWLMLRPFIGVLEWAAVLVIIFYPVHKRLAKKIRRRGLSALLSCLLVVVVVVLPLALLTMALANELTQVIPKLPSQLSRLWNTETPVIGKLSAWVHDHAGVDVQRSQEFLLEQLKRSGEMVLGLSLSLMTNIVGGIIKAFFVVFTMYYLFRDGDKIVKAVPGALPLSTRQSNAMLGRVSQVVSASVYGVVAIAMLQGLLGGVAFWALGVPSPILWAVVLAFVCMVPVAGSFFVWLPASVYLVLTGHWSKALLLVLWGALVISTIDNFLRPKLIGNQTKLHELFVFFSVLGGMSVFGLLGIVLGPVVLAITLGLLDTFKHNESEDASASGSVPFEIRRPTKQKPALINSRSI